MAHPRIQELLDHLTASRADLRAAVETVAPEMRERRPAPDRWSVAEILEHLSIVEARVADRLTATLAAARIGGLGPELETTPVMPTVDMRKLLDRANTRAAPEALHPHGMAWAAAWEALDRSRERFCEVVQSGDGLALGTLTMPHPALGELTLYQWIGTVGGHEARHAAQIREIGAAPAF
jgi:hypothetical protein